MKLWIYYVDNTQEIKCKGFDTHESNGEWAYVKNGRVPFIGWSIVNMADVGRAERNQSDMFVIMREKDDVAARELFISRLISEVTSLKNGLFDRLELAAKLRGYVK